ncbi:MAG: penicillin-binding protein 2 [Verrucomicrobiales bacterium]|nr:penicillin-binding protein 2 [Verrucomicrobiales bacterium]
MVTHFRIRLYILALLVLGMFAVLVLRLYRIQIIEHNDYVKRVPGERFESVRIPGIRGEIKDRNGITLAESVRNYELQFDLKTIRDTFVKNFGYDRIPKREWERIDKHGMKQKKKEDDIVQMVEETVFPGLAKLGLLAEYSSSAMQVHYRSTAGIVPFTYRRDLTFKEFARFAENNLGIPGVTVKRTGKRRYIYDSLGCHWIGYMNLADVETVPTDERKKFNYYVGDDYGVQGVEKTMDHYLRGKPGKLVIKKDEKGKYIGEVSRTEAQPGSDVYLTIDARIQTIAEQALRKIGRGAAVVVDPNNGEILAMASVPSFNPNAFIPEVSVDDWKRYTEDPTSPMFNRAVNPAAPGSTCKVPIALAGCLSESWKYRFSCGTGMQFRGKFMKCWCAGRGYSHGSPNVSEALKVSCNGFFYRYANHTGIRNIQTMTGLLGMGKPTGIKITGENGGTIPNPDWLRQKGLIWSDAFTALVSIGQGETEATPLQMASVTATVANGGIVYQPRIVKKVLEKDGEIVWEEPPKIRHNLLEEGLTAEQIETVKRGMWRVTNEAGGTAGRASSEITVLCGKTGTAQTGNLKEPTNAWFIAYAPYDKPEYAVCVFVQNGKSGGGAASPIAKKIIEEATAMAKHDHKIEVVAVEEAVGHRGRIESVSFEGGGMTLLAAADDASETAVDVQDFVPSQLRNSGNQRRYTPVQPSIKRSADRRGSVSNQNRKRTLQFRPFKKLFGGGR